MDDALKRFNHQSPDSRPVPPDLLQALRRPLVDLPKYFEAVRYRREHPGPEYTCPACKRLLKYRPVRVFDGKALKRTFEARSASEERDAVRRKGSDELLFVDCPLL